MCHFLILYLQVTAEFKAREDAEARAKAEKAASAATSPSAHNAFAAEQKAIADKTRVSLCFSDRVLSRPLCLCVCVERGVLLSTFASQAEKKEQMDAIEAKRAAAVEAAGSAEAAAAEKSAQAQAAVENENIAEQEKHKKV